jgi:tetratricopeptide (TPR) repeat protein
MTRVLRRFKNKPIPAPKAPEPKTPYPMKTKVWIFYIIITITLPCAFLFGAEIVLRLFHVGYDSRFFRQEKSQGSVYCVDNPSFGCRFFPSSLVRTPEKLRFPLRKDVNERRIFVLGSSAAQGDPAPAFAFSRDLGLMLKDRYELTRCEVISTAITATNSHVVVPIARECSHLSPDIFIVYLGNNEVIGPFGPGTIFSQFSGLWLIRLRIFLSSTRLGQLASALSTSIVKNNGTPADWGGMKMFLQHKVRFDDPKMTGVYRNYKENLREICKAARSSGAHVVLCTVASNLKDCGPFFSMHRPDLSPDTLKQWEGYFKQAVNSQRQGQFETALAQFTKASALDNTYADMHYRIAQCLSELERSDEARQHFIAARDYDAMRFRADSRINQIVKEVAREFTECAVLLDIDERLNAASDHGVCGETLFLEHVHYNFHGNYLFAANLLPLIDSLIAVPVVDARTVSEAECKERLAFTPWEDLWIGQEVYKRLIKPPFTNQEDNFRKAQDFNREIHRLSTQVADSGQNIIASYKRAVSLESKDWRVYNQLGKYLLLNTSNAVAAERAFRSALEIMPDNVSVSNDLAIALERQGRLAEAIGYYRESIKTNPLFFESYVNLADDLISTSRIDEAEQCLKQVLRINPGNLFAQERYAQVLFMRGKAATATRYVDKKIISPKVLAVCYNKDGMRLVNEGKIPDAITQFESAVAVYPELADAQSNLGRALVNTGKVSEGIVHFKEAVRLDSTRPDVHANFANAFAAQGMVDEAGKEYRAALSLNPKMVPALNGLGMLLIKQDSFPQARDLFVQTIQEQPSMLSAHQNLIAACAFMNQKDKAIDLLTQVLISHPQTAEIHYSLGKLLLEQGNVTEAQKQLRIAAQLRPDLPDLESLLSAASSRLISAKH